MTGTTRLDRTELSGHCIFDRKKNRFIFTLIALFIVLWTAVLYFYSPEQIVKMIGVHNVYIFILLLAMTGGVSIFTTTLFYTSLVAISLGGVNILLISLFASTGLLFGDIVFYYLAHTGSRCVPERYETGILSLKKWTKEYGDRKMVLIIFLYSMTPLPSDLISIFLGTVTFPIKKIILPMIFGKFILIIVFLELVKIGYGFL